MKTNQMTNYEIFLNGIYQKQKVKICYFSQKENKKVYRECAPLDYGPKRKPKAFTCFEYMDDWVDKYHFYDYDWSGGGHPTSKNPNEVISIELLDEKFDPARIVEQKKCPWFINRDRGIYS